MNKIETNSETRKYNKTQLSPDKVFERHVYHRDQFAHYLRWSHVLKISQSGKYDRVLDIGCGTGNLLEVLYHNRRAPELYVGCDVRTATIKHNQEKFKNLKWAQFQYTDFCKYMSGVPYYRLKNANFNLICCFEVFEHIGKIHGDQFLANIESLMRPETVLLISTPCYNGVDVADNHIIGGEIGEYTFKEMKYELEKFFQINQVWGTFASQKDVLPEINKYINLRQTWNELSEYYDSNLMSVLFAPLYPEQSRNCLWRCRLR